MPVPEDIGIVARGDFRESIPGSRPTCEVDRMEAKYNHPIPH